MDHGDADIQLMDLRSNQDAPRISATTPKRDKVVILSSFQFSVFSFHGSRFTVQNLEISLLLIRVIRVIRGSQSSLF
jgi:hypothetical protein